MIDFPRCFCHNNLARAVAGMADKVNLDIQTILDKEFNVDFKGYNATEVDTFLDLVIQDYQTYQDITKPSSMRRSQSWSAPMRPCVRS
jgi:DivIVA domain-containing protein